MTMTKIPTGRELADLMKQAIELGVLPQNFMGKCVLFTGTCSVKRDDLRVIARAAGAHVMEDVRANFYGPRHILVVGDTGRHGRTAKIRAAESQGWDVITEGEFCARVLAK